MKQMSDNGSIKRKVTECIVDELPKGNVNIEKICHAVNMSRSTLHRRLKEEATSFNSILVDVRKDLAISYLEQGMNTSQMAYLWGYSNASNFLNSFKRWFNTSLKNYRAKLNQQ